MAQKKRARPDNDAAVDDALAIDSTDRSRRQHLDDGSVEVFDHHGTLIERLPPEE